MAEESSPAAASNEPRWQVSWSKDGSLKHRKESDPVATLGEADQIGREKAASNKVVSVLKEGHGVNAGKFFLDHFVPSTRQSKAAAKEATAPMGLHEAQKNFPGFLKSGAVEAQAQAAFKEGTLWAVLDGTPHAVSANHEVVFHFTKRDGVAHAQPGVSSPQAAKEWSNVREMDATPTKVLFRLDRKEGDVYALMPELMYNHERHLCTTYAHVGQHSAADLHGCMKRSREAMPNEYKALATELGQRGYNIEIHTKTTPAMDDVREAAIKAAYPPAPPLRSPDPSMEPLSGTPSREQTR